MKFTSTLLLCCLVYSSASSQQWKFTGNYSLGMPQKTMGKNIQAVHSLQAGLLYRLPKQLNNFFVGLEFGIGTYARKQVEQTFTFDGVSTVVPVNYNSNVFNANLQTRFHLLNEDRFFVVPYLVGKAGLYDFHSNVVIEDPDDPDGCHALDRKNIIRDKTLYWSAGGGIQIDPAFFSKKKRRENIRIDISAQTVRGGSIDYINTKHLMDAQSVPEPGAKTVTARFINASTQHIHEHSVAQLYTSALKLFEIRAGVTVIF
jgi:hypothetical protein